MSDDLDSNIRDRIIAATKGAAGLIPYLGGPLGELINQTIPLQRQDRIVAYVRALEKRLQTLESGFVRHALSQPEKIDFVEKGGYQAARATTMERIELITQAVFNGIAAPDAEAIRRKRLLDLLGELDEDEVAILKAHERSYEHEDDSEWDKINRPPVDYMGAGRETHELNELYELGQERLLRLGLLEQRFPVVKRGELPEFDKEAGRFRGDPQISYLGRMLMREIGLSSAESDKD